MPTENQEEQKPAAQFDPPIDPMYLAQAEKVTTYHKPDEDGIRKIGNVRKAAQILIAVIAQNCPESADRSAAIRLAREAMMTANAAIVVPQVRI